MLRKLIAGNWKMNGLRADLETLRQVSARVNPVENGPEALLCVPATLLSAAAETVRGTALAVGGQTCSKLEKGAFTGDISAPMLAEAGATYVIVGHSERRTGHGETDADVAGQAASALKSGLTPSSASAKPSPSGKPAPRSPSSKASSRARLKALRRQGLLSSPMSPSGPSAPARSPRPARSPKSTPSSVPSSSAATAPRQHRPHPLWRQPEPRQRPRNPPGPQRRWRPHRRRQLEGGGLPLHLRDGARAASVSHPAWRMAPRALSERNLSENQAPDSCKTSFSSSIFSPVWR